MPKRSKNHFETFLDPNDGLHKAFAKMDFETQIKMMGADTTKRYTRPTTPPVAMVPPEQAAEGLPVKDRKP